MKPKYETLYLYQICDINLPSRVSNLPIEATQTYTLVDNECIDDKQCKIIKTKTIQNSLENSNEYFKAFKGDFILCLKQNFIKGDLTAAFIEDEEVLVTSNFAILTPKEYIHSDLIMWAFHQDYVISQIKPLNIGRNFFQVTADELSKILIPVEIYADKNSNS
ncbi:hypothetical protein [Clostridium sp. UBA4548]|uniref:hypothetical protein n=1 Tax=Clostridium sp. UBA4548 TaxID=1946361 RepID=UPI0025B9D022|nr:hypothetical protein [Clostridium sp. UBA4548]